MRVDGACHCGAVRFAARVDPKRVGACHCTDCQTFSGSAFRTSVAVSEDEFELLAGEPASYEKTAESGRRRQLLFCNACGTHLYGRSDAGAPRTYTVRVGVLSQRAELPPAIQAWCRSEQPWLAQLDTVPKIETQ